MNQNVHEKNIAGSCMSKCDWGMVDVNVVDECYDTPLHVLFKV